MTYTIADIKRMLQVYSRQTVAKMLDISTIQLNALTNSVPTLSGIKQPISKPKFTLTQGGTPLIQSDDTDAPVFEVGVLREMLISTEKGKVAETLGISTVGLNKLIASFPEHFSNLPKAVKLPFTLVDESGNPIIITKQTEEVPVNQEVVENQPEMLSTDEVVTESLDNFEESAAEEQGSTEEEATEQSAQIW